MKKAEQTLSHERAEFSNNDFYRGDPIINAMKEYAQQEVKKHLAIAADKAEITCDKVWHEWTKTSTNINHRVISESITNIKIELT